MAKTKKPNNRVGITEVTSTQSSVKVKFEIINLNNNERMEYSINICPHSDKSVNIHCSGGGLGGSIRIVDIYGNGLNIKFKENNSV